MDFNQREISPLLTMLQGGTFQLLICCVKGLVDDNVIAYGMTWMNLKREAQLDNVFCATHLAIGTLVVPFLLIGLQRRVNDEPLEEGDDAVEEEKEALEEETSHVLICGTIFVLSVELCFNLY